MDTLLFNIKKNKIKRKRLQLIKLIKIITTNFNFKSTLVYTNYSIKQQLNNPFKLKSSEKTNKFIINLSQKIHNPKVVITIKKPINTFSVGAVLKFFKIKHCKSIRRSLKGFKVFLNLIKNILTKKYFNVIKGENFYMLINLTNYTYNYRLVKKTMKSLFNGKGFSKNRCFFLFNLKISFTKIKSKRIKSIKKRLKKKMFLQFLKNINVINKK